MYVNLSTDANYKNLNIKPSFKGSIKKTEQGNPYYSSTSATNIGFVTSAIALGIHISNMFLKEPTLEEAEKYVSKLKDQLKDNPFFKPENIPSPEEHINTIKKAKKYALPFALIAGAASFGCGFFVDKIRNQKATETADKIKKLGLKNAMLYDENIDMSRNGRGYYNSNIGNKYGAILGAICGCIAAGMTGIKNNRDFKILTTAISLGVFALGGWLIGKLADSKTNDNARIYS